MEITDEMLYQHAAEARDLWLSTLPTDDDIPEHKFSKKFERKMNRLLREQRRSPWANRAIRTMRRVAAVILVVGVLSFSGLMTVEAYREKVGKSYRTVTTVTVWSGTESESKTLTSGTYRA